MPWAQEPRDTGKYRMAHWIFLQKKEPGHGERGSAILSAVSFYRVSSRTAAVDTTDLKETPVGTGSLLDQLFFLLEG